MKRLAAWLLAAAALAWAPQASAAAPAVFDGWTLQGVAIAGGEARLAVDVGGLMTSPAISVDPFSELVASWDAVALPGSWIEVQARVLQSPGWSRWYSLGVWSSDGGLRHSVDGQNDPRASVVTDTLITAAGLPASAYQLQVALSPGAAVRLVRATTGAANTKPDRDYTGVELLVPRRSQMLPEYRGLGFGGGGEAWCSPTSLSMIMAYWASQLHLPQLDVPVPAVAAGTYDPVYRGAGNWPFNTAFAGSYGLTAYVERFASFDQLEPWIRAGVPIAVSIRFGSGQLLRAPIDSSPGHLIVVRGFTADGDVIVNDPAGATNDDVRIVYNRAQLERGWLSGSHGTAYVIYPPGWQVPTA